VEPSHSRVGKLRRVPRVLVGILLGLAVVAMTGYAGFKIWSRVSDAPSEIRSIAILPLQNLSGDPGQEYFADGMTEELIADLGQVSALRVISRTSAMTYKGTKKLLPEIASELGVDAVVEGSVVREGNQARITAQLINARTDHHIWARTYTRNMTSVLELQGEVAQAIADAIRIEVTPQEKTRLSRVQPINVEAHELYLQGRQRLNLGDPRGALGLFQKSVDQDPEYAAARAALADSYGWLGESGLMDYAEAFPHQKAEAAKAIALDDALPEGHVELAKAVAILDWDFATAEKEFKRALEINPNAASIYLPYSRYLEKTGRTSEALAETKLALGLDPFSTRAFLSSAYTYYYARRYEQALAQSKRAYELNPGHSESPGANEGRDFAQLGMIYAEKGMYEEAVLEFQKLGDHPHALGHLGNAYARMGRAAEARNMITKLREHVKKSGIGPYEIALVYAGLDEKDEAFAWLDQAFAAHDKGLTYLKIDPCIDPLRTDPRYGALVKRVGLPL